MGGEAVRLLIELIDDPSRPPARVVLPTRLVVRQSCRAIAETAHDDRREHAGTYLVSRRGSLGRRARRRPARPDDARGEGGAARQRLGLPAARRRALLARSRPSALAEHGLGQVTRVCGASSFERRGGRGGRERDPALPRRGDPARHPRDRARGDLLGPDGARRRPSSRRRSASRARGSPSSRARSPTRSARRCARSARTRACRRCSTSAAIRAGAARRRRSARTRTSSRAWASRSSAGCRATTCATASSRPPSTSSATAPRRAA